ncbi:hypothetical protein AVEN_188761-1 [Araneus ventricosus]|uniref:Uncharacterized protein n=1 Tax=Araneus ventricosus TaxID=182803 RepID=A0A4Y2SC56_ARAVE|nr:hypothetical protein AVEN_188761-1 [Araneus ventricosus]
MKQIQARRHHPPRRPRREGSQGLWILPAGTHTLGVTSGDSGSLILILNAKPKEVRLRKPAEWLGYRPIDTPWNKMWSRGKKVAAPP